MNDATLMMSEELMGKIAELENQGLGELVASLVFVSMKDENTGLEISGPISAVLFSEDPEVEIKMDLGGAMNILANKSNVNKINGIKIIHGSVVAVQEGEFYLDLAKILDINLDEQTCVFAAGLKKKR